MRGNLLVEKNAIEQYLNAVVSLIVTRSREPLDVATTQLEMYSILSEYMYHDLASFQFRTLRTDQQRELVEVLIQEHFPKLPFDEPSFSEVLVFIAERFATTASYLRGFLLTLMGTLSPHGETIVELVFSSDLEGIPHNSVLVTMETGHEHTTLQYGYVGETTRL